MRENGNNGRGGRATLSLMIAAMLAVTAFAFLTDSNESGQNDTVLGANEDVVITGLAEWQIETNLQDAIDDVENAGGGTVTVTGSKTDVSDGVYLSIPDDVTMIWKAVYEGTIDAPGGYSYNRMISFYNGGTFDVADGGSLIAAFPNNGGIALDVSSWGYVKVSGGTVSVSGNNTTAVHINNGGAAVTGGTVSADGNACTAIIANWDYIKVSGGTVSALGDDCAALYASWSCDITVTGGTVTADINGGSIVAWAIYVYQGTAAVRGGSVSAFDSTSSGTGGTWAICIGDAGVAAYVPGACTGSIGADIGATAGWIAKVSDAWTGTEDSELTLVWTTGYTDVRWGTDSDGLYVADNADDVWLLWDEITYDSGDIAVIEGMIDNNGLMWPTAPADANGSWFSSDWPHVVWDGLYPVSRITALYVYNEGLTGTLDVSGLTMLRLLYCYDNSLTSLDVSGLTVLVDLDCSYNSLTSLDVSSNTMLEYMNCGDNSLTSLDVSSNTMLEYLYCYGNSLTSLDVSGLTVLRFLYCYGNYLAGTLDVSSNTILEYLHCYDNSLTSLDVSGLTVLEDLDCNGNYLAVLDVSDLTALRYMDCSGNYLAVLDVSSNTILEYLNCAGNGLTVLTVAGLQYLGQIECQNNEITGLDVTGLPALWYLDVSWNQIDNTNDVVDTSAPFAPSGGWDAATGTFFFSPQCAVDPIGLSEVVSVPAGDTGTGVSIDLESLISRSSGGPYTYTYIKISGPDWLDIDGSTGMITGTRPATSQAETTMIIGVEDSSPVHKAIVITVGAVTGGSGPGGDPGNGTGSDPDDGGSMMLIIAVVAIAAIAAVAVYLFVLRPKK